MLKNSTSVLETTMSGLHPTIIKKHFHKTSVMSSGFPPLYEKPVIKTSGTKINNQDKTDKEGYTLWKGKRPRNKTIQRQSLNLSNKLYDS